MRRQGMKGIVVYYSATGNTRKLARAIHRGMKDVMAECDIASIREADPQALKRYDLIGIGAPIWFFREPANVRTFIYNMPKLEGKLCFPFCAHGSAPAGFMFSVVPALKRKGLTIIGYNDWYGSVDQVLHMPKPYVTDGHPDEIDLKEAENFGREMAVRAQRISSGQTHLIPKLPKGAKADPLWQPHPLGQPRPSPAGQMTRPQRKINMEKCTYPECTICVDNCPVNSIDFSVNPPVIKQNCINDSLCDKMCPVGAIEVDEETLRGRPQRKINMEKCTYPECTLCVDHCPMNSIDFSVTPPVIKWNCEGDDLCWVICPQDAIEITNLETAHIPKLMKNTDHDFAKLLAEAEAKGRFRRLVPLDKVGWDNPIYKIKKYPRFVIEED
jgi:NAD-dependent dihydropyrimidine dehydrogenase PreA subunit/flavodoxin